MLQLLAAMAYGTTLHCLDTGKALSIRSTVRIGHNSQTVTISKKFTDKGKVGALAGNWPLLPVYEGNSRPSAVGATILVTAGPTTLFRVLRHSFAED